MTSLQALSILNRWLHDRPPDPVTPEPAQNLPLNTPSDEPGCMGYQVGVGTILHQQQHLLEQLYEQLHLPDELLPLFNASLDRLVDWVHLLPAHPQHHCEPAGAVRHALETAFWATSATEQVHFDHALYPDQRRARQPLWRLMAGVAGLLYDAGRIVSSIEVTDPEAGHWPSLQTGLGSWLQTHRITHYCPHWVQSDNRPDKALPSEYTCTNLLLLDKLTHPDSRHALKPDHDQGALWQTFIAGLTGLHSPKAVPQMVTAIEVARLKSVKLHFIRGEALSALTAPKEPGQSTDKDTDTEECTRQEIHECQNPDTALKNLQQIVTRLEPNTLLWKKDSLVLRWPQDLQSADQDGFPNPEQLLEQWSQQGWLRQVGEDKTFLRSGQRYVFLQPAISQQCQQWLKTPAPPEQDTAEC